MADIDKGVVKNECSTEESTGNVDKKLYDALIEHSETLSNLSTEHFKNITKEDSLSKIEQWNFVVFQKSEEAYIDIVRGVVEKSSENLNSLRNDKNELRNVFVNFFTYILKLQIWILIILLICKGFEPSFIMPNEIIITFMTVVFLETLGVITLMIKFAFKSSEEIKIIDILNSVVSNYQKYNNKK